jgi:hypothetical protein
MPNGSLEVEAAGPKWRRPLGRSVLVALLAWGLAVFCAAPSLHYFELDQIFNSRAGEFVQQCANPLTRAITGAPFLGYRVFVPTVAWLLGARLYVALALPYVATIAFLSVVCFVMTERHGRRMGTIATMLVATSYAVTWPDCMLGYPDSVAHLLAACLLLTRRPWLIGAMVAAGMLTDERFILELPFVFLWHYCAPASREGRWLRNAWLPVILGLAVCLVVRRALTIGWIGPGIAAPKTYGDILNTLYSMHPYNMSWGVWLANVFMGFRWTWIVVVAGVAFRARHRQGQEVPIFVVILSGCVAASMLVFDAARSVGFCYIAIILSLSWLIEAAPGVARRLGQWSAWMCFLTPSLWVVPGYVIWLRPLPLRVVAFLSNRDPLDWIHWLKNVH